MALFFIGQIHLCPPEVGPNLQSPELFKVSLKCISLPPQSHVPASDWRDKSQKNDTFEKSSQP